MITGVAFTLEMRLKTYSIFNRFFCVHNPFRKYDILCWKHCFSTKKSHLTNQPFLAEMLFIFSRKGSSTQNFSKAFKGVTNGHVSVVQKSS